MKTKRAHSVRMLLPAVLLAAPMLSAPVLGGGTNIVEGEVVYLFDFDPVNDSSGNDNTGDKFAGPIMSADVPFPAAYSNNQSIQFTGTGEGETLEPHVRIMDDHPASPTENVVDISLGDLTIETWVKPNVVRGMTFFKSADVRQFSNQAVTLSIDSSSNNLGKVRFNFNDGEPIPWDFNSATTNDMQAGVWTHVAAVIDRTGVQGTPSNAYIFINGVVSTNLDFSLGLGNIQNESPLESYIMAVGTEFHGPAYPTINTVNAMDGLMDEFRIVKRALTAAEILADSLNSIGPGLAPDAPPAGPPAESFTLIGSGPDTGFTFTTASNVNYALQSTDLTCSNLWRDASYTIHGDGSAMTVYDSEDFSVDNLYRIIALP